MINFLSGEDKKQSQAKYSIDSMPTRRTRNKEMSDFDEEDVITDSNPSSASNDHILSLLQKMSAEMSEWRTEQMDLRKEMDDRFALIISDGKNGARTMEMKTESTATPTKKQNTPDSQTISTPTFYTAIKQETADNAQKATAVILPTAVHTHAVGSGTIAIMAARQTDFEYTLDRAVSSLHPSCTRNTEQVRRLPLTLLRRR